MVDVGIWKLPNLYTTGADPGILRRHALARVLVRM